MKKIAIFASGSGSNAQKIIEHFASSRQARVAVVLSNNPNAYVLERARNAGIPTVVFDRAQWGDDLAMRKILKGYAIDLIVLAGFLWLLPPGLVEAYRGRILNIHPSLLPKYGGRGMYGERVHRAVIDAGEPESGITIHHVNEIYDTGDIIEQHRLEVFPDDSPETLAARIHDLEHRYFPPAVERCVAALDKITY